ncbi:MAG: cell division protein FtsQ/DivIB [Sphingobacteriaceae bacterium]
MIKRINWKGILIALAWVVSLSGLVFLMSFIDKEKRDQKCTEVKVLIPGNQNFISRQEVDRIIWNAGGTLSGKQLNLINTQAVEDALKQNPFIRTAKVYADMNGIVWVRILQREPILRIINNRNQDFYVDQEGYKIPVSPNFTAAVLVANGNISEDLESRVRHIRTPLGKDLFKIARMIQQDTLWSNQIEQVYVNANAEIELVPRVGDQQIILGNADSLSTKLNNLLVFYKKAMPKVGWNTYTTINLKYVNQIVCTKNGFAIDSVAAPVLADTTQIKQAKN